MTTVTLKELLNDDGIYGLGIAGAGEMAVSEKHRIPVPRNIGIADSANPADIVRVAKWAYDQYLTINPGFVYGAISVFNAYLYGCVTLKAAPGAELPDTVEALQSLDWDAEVTVYDIDVPDLGDPMTMTAVRQLFASTAPMRRSVSSLVIAGKITWWATQHHLGADITRPGTPRSSYGYLEKVVETFFRDVFTWTNPEHKAAIYNIVHPWSTRKVMWLINREHRHEIHISYAIPIAKDGEPRFVEIEMADDAALRTAGFGAGYAPLNDVKCALSILSRSPIFLMCPGLGTVVSFIDEWVRVSREPYCYGTSAAYLSPSPKGTRFDQTPYMELITGVVTWVRATIPNSPLGRAAIFNQDPATMPLYSQAWEALCNEFRIAALDAPVLRRGQLRRIVSTLGISISATFDASMLRHFAQIGVTVNEEMHRAAYNVIRESRETTEGPSAEGRQARRRRASPVESGVPARRRREESDDEDMD